MMTNDMNCLLPKMEPKMEAWEAVKHDHEVHILVDNPTEENRIFTCRPEPYLRKFIHNPVNGEEDDEEHIELPAKDVNETTVGPTASTTHVKKRTSVDNHRFHCQCFGT